MLEKTIVHVWLILMATIFFTCSVEMHTFGSPTNLQFIKKHQLLENFLSKDIPPPPSISKHLVVDPRQTRTAFRTIQLAIDSVPDHNDEWVSIHVRDGHYNEKIIIPSTKPYIFLHGDGALATVITWNDSAGSFGTADSATFTINAPHFVATNIGFMNTAPHAPPGANGGQAVAVLLSGDMIAFYGCGFYGAQDTLFDYEGRHFFKDCYIEGSIDFIFGHGQSIYMGCALMVNAQPGYLSGSITAQNRNDLHEKSGFVFMNCSIFGTGEAFLGRAWGDYSRVIFMYTYMSNVVSPQGWDDWGNHNRQRTVYYGEYKCYGEGAKLDERVPWSHELSDMEAKPFLQLDFINGDEWLFGV